MRIAALCQRATVVGCGTITDCILVIGAGTAQVNGTYINDGFGNWTNPFGYFMLENTGGYRATIFNVSFQAQYSLPETEDFPCGQWIKRAFGTNPPPTAVVYVSCGECAAPLVPDVEGTYDESQNLNSITVTSNTTGNVGGTFQLWGVENGVSTLISEQTNANDTFTGPWASYTYLFVVEVGNGVDWCGSSESSVLMVNQSFSAVGGEGGDFLAGEGASEPIIGEIPTGIFISSLSINTFTQCFTGAPVVAVFGNGFESGGYFAIPILRGGVPDTIYYDGVRSPGTSQFIDSNTMLLNTFLYSFQCPDAGTYDLQYYKPDNTLAATFALSVILTPMP